MNLPLSARQGNALRKLSRSNGGVVWWRVGTGKTRIAYGFFAMVAKQFQKSPCHTFLVVCRRAAFDDWKNEATKVGMDCRFAEIDEEDDLYIKRTHRKPFFVMLVSHAMLYKLRAALDSYGIRIDAMVIDEGYLYKNCQTKKSKAANSISEGVVNSLLLSGSIMTARNLEDIYGQLYAVGKHTTVAKTLTEFRSKYMMKFSINIGSNPNPTFLWRAQKNAKVRLMQKIRSLRSLYFPPNNGREIVTSIQEIAPSKEQLYLLKELRELYSIDHRGVQMELKNAMNMQMIAQAISDGWAKGMGNTIDIAAPKLDYLVDLLLEILVSEGISTKIVIWCAFKHSVEIVLQRLQKEFGELGLFRMTGTSPLDIQGWLTRGNICVATEASGSSVNHFKDCAYAIYYSMDGKWLSLQQSRGRTNREDSPHLKCFYYHLHTKGSLDSVVYKAATNSGREEQTLIDISKWLTEQKAS